MVIRLSEGRLRGCNVQESDSLYIWCWSELALRIPNRRRFGQKGKTLKFAGFKFHHLRGTHATLLLDRGVPVHTVAERIGDDPSVLLKNYAKRKRKQAADTSVASVISALAAGFIKA